MTASSATKLSLALLTTGGIGGTTAYGIYEFTRETISDRLKGTLLTKEESDKEKWKNRATTLKADKTNPLSKSLKAIQNGKEDGTDLKEWCDTNLKNKFTSEKDQLFKEIQKYCVYNIKEKAGQVVETGSWVNDTHNKKLKEFQATTNKKLSPTMQKIKDDLGKSNGENALKAWCSETYNKPFKGEEDQDFLDAKEYCVTT